VPVAGRGSHGRNAVQLLFQGADSLVIGKVSVEPRIVQGLTGEVSDEPEPVSVSFCAIAFASAGALMARLNLGSFCEVLRIRRVDDGA
jgi:hypothetical protein